MSGRLFSRRRLLIAAGFGGLAIGASGCQSVQQSLGGTSAGGGGDGSLHGPLHRLWAIRHATGPRSRSKRSSSLRLPTSRSSGSRPAGRPSAKSTWPPGRPTRPRTSACSARPISTQAVRLGSLEDLNPAFKQWPEKDQKDLSKAWWDTGTSDGKKYIAPLLLVRRHAAVSQEHVREGWGQYRRDPDLEAVHRGVPEGRGGRSGP